MGNWVIVVVVVVIAILAAALLLMRVRGRRSTKARRREGLQDLEASIRPAGSGRRDGVGRRPGASEELEPHTEVIPEAQETEIWRSRHSASTERSDPEADSSKWVLTTDAGDPDVAGTDDNTAPTGGRRIPDPEKGPQQSPSDVGPTSDRSGVGGSSSMADTQISPLGSHSARPFNADQAEAGQPRQPRHVRREGQEHQFVIPNVSGEQRGGRHRAPTEPIERIADPVRPSHTPRPEHAGEPTIPAARRPTPDRPVPMEPSSQWQDPGRDVRSASGPVPQAGTAGGGEHTQGEAGRPEASPPDPAAAANLPPRAVVPDAAGRADPDATVNPTTVNPATVNPATLNATTADPATAHPAAADPTTAIPRMRNGQENPSEDEPDDKPRSSGDRGSAQSLADRPQGRSH